jgi:hypothetical protein
LLLARDNRYPDQLMAPFGLLYNWHWVLFPWIKQPGHGADQSVHIVLRLRMSGFVSPLLHMFSCDGVVKKDKKLKFTIEQAMKVQRGSRGKALLFL